MANEKNLIPNNKRTPSELREMTKKGGIESGKSRRRKKTMKEVGNVLLQMQVCDSRARKSLKAQGIAEDDMDNITALMAAMIKRAQRGSVQAAEFVRDTTGQNVATNEDLKLRKEELKLKREAMKDPEPEASDDGFLDALRDCAADDWKDGDDEPPED